MAAPFIDPFVNIANLEFAYAGNRDRLILRDVTVQVPRGQVVALMGGSGCGKTTLLRLIGGQFKPTAGKLEVNGESVADLDKTGLYALRRRMGMLFQFGALFTDMTVFDNVAFPLREHTNLPESMIRDLVLLKLNAVGLRGAHQLIMYDEPFAGLDPISMNIIANLIRRLNDALGATSLIVSHDVDETFAIADYVYVLADGKVAAEGTPAQLRASTDPFVHQFVHGEPEGPVPFHYPAPQIASDLGLAGARRLVGSEVAHD